MKRSVVVLGMAISPLVLLPYVALTADSTVVCGTIAGQVWTKDKSPYKVVCDIRVASLEIKPGVTVAFAGNYIFEVIGKLTAVGTKQDSIVFTKNASAPGWNGIFFNQIPPGSELAYCRIEYSVNRGLTINRSSVAIRNSTISDNSKNGGFYEAGGGIYADAGSPLMMTDCSILRNGVTAYGIYSAGWGGGIWAQNDLTLINCVIDGNGASAVGFMGSGDGHGGGIFCEGKTILKNCIVSNNYGQNRRGGMDVASTGTAEVINCTFVYNTNGGVGADGTTKIVNSIFYFNSRYQIYQANITYCDVQGGTSDSSNIDYNPVFWSNTCFMIAPGSPCIDAGNPDPSYNDVCFPPSLGGKRNDMGAHGGPDACNVVVCGNITDVAQNNNNVPVGYALDQNYPNPFNPETTILYELPRASEVEVAVFNLLGEKIRTLVNQPQQAGQHRLLWNGRDENEKSVPSGVYFYRLRAGEFMQTRKMILMQ